MKTILMWAKMPFWMLTGIITCVVLWLATGNDKNVEWEEFYP